MAFDTLTYAKKLQEAGVPSSQAEAHAEALKELAEGNLATKQDIDSVRLEIESVRLEIEQVRHEIELLRRELKQDIELVRREMKEMETGLRHEIALVRREIELARRDIVIWLGGLIIVTTTALGVLMKLL